MQWKGTNAKVRTAFRWLAIFLGAILAWGLITDHGMIWPIRNTLDYYLAQTWWRYTGYPSQEYRGSARIQVLDFRGRPVPQAVALLSEWDGAVHSGRTNPAGVCMIQNVPAGFYRIAATAPGYRSEQSGGILRGITVRPRMTSDVSLTLTPAKPKPVQVLPPPQANDSQSLVCSSPVQGSAVRQTLTFNSGHIRYSPIFLYRPENLQGQKAPLLLTVYPGPVDTWECVSIGLTQAGYAVLAVGPEYSMDLSGDVEQLANLLHWAKTNELEGVDNRKIAALGGSYSALILQQLMLREAELSAVVLLGPPTDMFDFRRRFERENFMPPFGLDRALIAMGLPTREPLRYLENSMVYHVRPGLPPTLLFHSYQDEIVPYQQSRLLAEALREKGNDAELHLFEGTSHYLLEDGEASMKIYHQTLDFLARHQMPPFGGKRSNQEW